MNFMDQNVKAFYIKGKNVHSFHRLLTIPVKGVSHIGSCFMLQSSGDNNLWYEILRPEK